MSSLTGFSMACDPHTLRGPHVSALLPEASSLLALILAGKRKINLARAEPS